MNRNLKDDLVDNHLTVTYKPIYVGCAEVRGPERYVKTWVWDVKEQDDKGVLSL